ncbi:MAG: hypothetical protein ACXVP7_02215 [Actinomycetota bacterium]
MADATPSFDRIRGLIESHKPPLACRVIETRGDEVVRSASVVFDGINGWYIDDGERIELRAAEDRVTFVENGAVERIGPGMVASSANWVKSAIDGRRIAYLDQASRVVAGREEVGGRSCWVVVDVEGLKRGGDGPFRLHVDEETGIILRMSRDDVGEVLRIEDLVLGTAQGPG